MFMRILLARFFELGEQKSFTDRGRYEADQMCHVHVCPERRQSGPSL